MVRPWIVGGRHLTGPLGYGTPTVHSRVCIEVIRGLVQRCGKVWPVERVLDKVECVAGVNRRWTKHDKSFHDMKLISQTLQTRAPTERQTEGGTDGRVDGRDRRDGRTEGRTNGERMDGRTEGRTGRTDGGTDGPTDGTDETDGTDGRRNGWTSRRTVRDGRTDGGTDGRTNGRTDGRAAERRRTDGMTDGRDALDARTSGRTDATHGRPDGRTDKLIETDVRRRQVRGDGETNGTIKLTRTELQDTHFLN